MLLLYLGGVGGCGWCLGGLEPNNEVLSGKVISGWTPKTARTASGSPELDGRGVFLSTGYLPAGLVSCSGEEEGKKRRKKR